MAKPTVLPLWDTTEVNSIAPDSDHEDQGWLAPGGVPEKPPFQTFNFWQNNVYKWIDALNELKVESVNVVEITSSGTYSKPSNLLFAIVEVQGGGGGSGGCGATSSSEIAISSGGSAGGYSKKSILSGDLFASETVTIGASGSSGAAGANNGGTGGTTSFGVHCSGTGGTGGTGGTASTGSGVVAGSNGGTSSGGDINVRGEASTDAAFFSGVFSSLSKGADSMLGAGGRNSTVGAGDAGTGYGCGGGGSARQISSAAVAGAPGKPGVTHITEYLGA